MLLVLSRAFIILKEFIMKSFTENNVKILSKPSDVIIKAIADKHGVLSDKVFRGLKHTIERAHSYTGYFCVVLYSKKNAVIGFAHLFKMEKKLKSGFTQIYGLKKNTEG